LSVPGGNIPEDDVGAAQPGWALEPANAPAGAVSIKLTQPINLLSGTDRTTGKVYRHVVILNDAGRLFIRDLSGQVKLHVNGRPSRGAALRAGDVVRMGAMEYQTCGTTAAVPAEPADRWGHVRVPDGGRPSVLDVPVTVVGGCERADVRLAFPDVEPVHALIVRLAGSYWVLDLDSPSGTAVDGKAGRMLPLTDGALLTVGSGRLVFETVRGTPLEAEKPVRKATRAAGTPISAQAEPPTPAPAPKQVSSRPATTTPATATATATAAPPAQAPFPPAAGDDLVNPASLAPGASKGLKDLGPLAFAMVAAMSTDPGGPSAVARRRWRTWMIALIAVVCILALLAGGWLAFGDRIRRILR
jgi:pSer/pThr/pTyr-binding forkhead associated (FHA) protein